MCSPRLWRKGEKAVGAVEQTLPIGPQAKGQMFLSRFAPGCAVPSVLQCLVRLGEHSCLVCHRELDVLLPDIDYVEIPVDWWNAEADKSLLIGVFKHGMYPAGLLGASV